MTTGSHTHKQNFAVFFFSSAIILCAEVYIFDALQSGAIPLYVTVIFHAIIVICIALFAIWHRINHYDPKMIILLGVMVFATGPFGAIICLISSVAHKFYSKGSFSFIEWFSSIFSEDDNITKGSKVYKRIIYGLDNISETAEIETFDDILSYGNLRQKQEALTKISTYFTPDFAPALLKAVHSPDSAIRVQAATVLAKIENQFTKRNLTLQKELEAEPKNTAKMLAYGEFCSEYADSGVLDYEREQQSRNDAIMIYEKCRNLHSEDNEIKIILGNLYLQIDEPEKAYKCFSRCKNESENISSKIFMGKAEALFEMKNFKDLRKLVKQNTVLFDKENQNTEIGATIKLWLA